MNQVWVGHSSAPSGMIAGGTAGMQDQAQGHIPEAVNEQDNYLNKLADEIGSLEVRIGTLVRPDSPAAPSSAPSATASPQMSQAATVVFSHNQRLYGQILRLRGLCARVDI